MKSRVMDIAIFWLPIVGGILLGGLAGNAWYGGNKIVALWLTFFGLICFALVAVLQIQQAILQSKTSSQQPDVALSFVYPKSPALVLTNNSDVIARDIKWTVILLNMDLPDRDEPLPIPIATFDWLRPRAISGPLTLFGSGLVAPLLKPGDHLFGSASVVCPGCARGRTYIVYIVWGEGGWFAEAEDEKSGDVIVPRNFLRQSRLDYFNELQAAVSPQTRLPIGPR
jgi:hypothetical protein